MIVSKWLFGVVFTLCCQVIASDKETQVFDNKNEWYVTSIERLRSKQFSVWSNNGKLLYIVCHLRETDLYETKFVSDLVKNERDKNTRYPFYIGDSKGDSKYNYNYILNWFNKSNNDKGQMQPPRVVPNIPMLPLTESLHTDRKSNRYYRIYDGTNICLQHSILPFGTMYTEFIYNKPLYRVFKSPDGLFYKKDLLSDQDVQYILSKKEDNAEVAYASLEKTFLNFMNMAPQHWNDKRGDFKLKIIEEDSKYISHIIANSSKCIHRIIDKSTIQNGKKTNGYVVKETCNHNVSSI